MDNLGAADRRDVSTPTRPAFTNHHMGTVRMGEDRTSSVVDDSLRCHDVSNLYLCTSGVFPTTGAVPPTLTIAALSLRLADQLTR